MVLIEEYKKKTVLITGGSRGIGKSCVELFAQAGSNVVFTYSNNVIAAESVLNTLADLNVSAHSVDLRDENGIKKLIVDTFTKFDSIDVLINNAGIWNYGAIDEMSLEHWRELIDINLTGTFLFTKYASQIMKKQNSGKIVNVTSTAGQRGEAFHSHYASSKGAQISFTKSLATELAEFNINVNAVAPGWVDTKMNDEVFAEDGYRKSVEESIPLKRIATAEDIAKPIMFLCSDGARHITGEVLNINGGSVLCG